MAVSLPGSTVGVRFEPSITGKASIFVAQNTRSRRIHPYPRLYLNSTQSRDGLMLTGFNVLSSVIEPTGIYPSDGPPRRNASATRSVLRSGVGSVTSDCAPAE